MCHNINLLTVCFLTLLIQYICFYNKCQDVFRTFFRFFHKNVWVYHYVYRTDKFFPQLSLRVELLPSIHLTLPTLTTLFILVGMELLVWCASKNQIVTSVDILLRKSPFNRLPYILFIYKVDITILQIRVHHTILMGSPHHHQYDLPQTIVPFRLSYNPTLSTHTPLCISSIEVGHHQHRVLQSYIVW